MKKRLIALVGAALMVLSIMPAASAAKPKWAEKIDASIVELVVANPDVDGDGEGDFDTLLAAVLQQDALAQANGGPSVLGILTSGDDYTVFAPTDDAFAALFEVVPAATVLSDFDLLTTVLGYHATEGVRNSKSVTSAKQITMLLGGTISAKGGLPILTGSGQEVGAVATDFRLTNGMVHVVDTVLLP